MWSDVFLFPMHKNFFLPFSAGNTKAEPKKKNLLSLIWNLLLPFCSPVSGCLSFNPQAPTNTKPHTELRGIICDTFLFDMI